jgi:hypothetical protein
VIAIQPRARGHILIASKFIVAITFCLLTAGWLDACVPTLSARFANVSSPSTTKCVIVLLHGDPRNACGVVVIGNGNVASPPAGFGWIDDYVADAA